MKYDPLNARIGSPGFLSFLSELYYRAARLTFYVRDESLYYSYAAEQREL